MQHPLLERIGEVARRVRRVWLVYGASVVVLCTLSAALLAMGLDWWFRWEDVLLRVLSTLAVAGALGWSLWNYLRPAVREPLDELGVALRIERARPEWRDRLASVVAFLQQSADDPSAGSASLRRAAVRQTTAELDGFPWSSLIQWKRTARFAAAAGGVALLAVLLTLLSPGSAAVAATRLLFPLGGPAWPQRHDLVLEAPPDRVASNQPIELRLRDANGVLPREVRAYLRPAGDTSVARTQVQRFLAGDPSELKIVYPAQRESVELRFEGGDDRDMHWHTVRVLPPPTLTNVRIEIEPPAYSGLPARTSERFIQTLQGSKVALAGRSAKPLSKMSVLVAGKEVAGTLSADKLDFSASFVAEASGDYALRVQDLDGFQGGDETPSQLFVQADEPPSISVERPASGSVSPNASVPISVALRDDLALKSAGMKWFRGGSQNPPKSSAEAKNELPLFTHPTGTPQPPLEGNPPRPIGESRTAAAQWDLSKLEPPLKPGEQLTLWFTASDFRPNVVETEPVRLTVVAPADLLDQITARQSQILGKLSQQLQKQRDARSRASEVEITLDQTGKWTPGDLDRLQGAELQQREIGEGLGDGPNGVPAQIKRMLEELNNNRLDDSETRPRLESLLSRLNKLQHGEAPAEGQPKKPGAVPQITSDLNTALKALRSEPTPSEAPSPAAAAAAKEAKDNLSRAVEKQETVIQSLSGMLGELAEWNDARRFREEIRGLLQSQDDLAKATAKRGLGESKDDKQGETEKKKLVRKQQELAAEVDRLMQRMQETGEQWKKSNPEAADAVRDSIASGREKGVAAGMREAARELDQGRSGNAGEQQSKASEGLKEMLDSLTQRPEASAEALLEKLRQAEKELEGLKKQQADVAEGLRKAARQPTPQARKRELARLRPEQERLREQTDRLARKLMRLKAEKASDALKKAGESMQQAGAPGDDSGDADSQADDAEQAEKDIEDAQEALAEERRQAEADLAFEKLLKMEDRLTLLKERQDQLAKDVGESARILRGTGSLSPAQRKTLAELAEPQSEVRRETQSIAEDLEAAVVFKLALEGAAGEMEQAAKSLAEPDGVAQAAESAAGAARRLAQLLEALDLQGGEEGPEEGGKGAGAESGGEQKPDEQKPPADGIPSLSQLKLLKLFQQELNRRTQALEEAIQGGGALSPAQRAESQRLADEQEKLRKLLVSLSEKAS